MNKPTNYDNISLHADPVELGGHYAVIKKVAEQESKSGRQQIVIYIEFDQQDPQAGYFKKQFDASDRQDKKWPAGGTFYITKGDKEEYFNKSIKQFVTAYEDSNGTQAIWGDKWAAQFTNKKIGVVYGEEEWFDDSRDEIRTSRKIRYFCDVHAAMQQDTPKKKALKGEYGTHTADFAGTVSEGGFLEMPDTEDDGFPFK